MRPTGMGPERIDLLKEFRQHQQILLEELKERNLWFIRLRWWVPLCLLAGTIGAQLLGVDFQGVAILAIAVFMLGYNGVFALLSREIRKEPLEHARALRRFTGWQVAFDYGTMFLLIHFTGGAASPFIFFFIFHVVFTSLLLPGHSVYAFAALAAGGMSLLAAAEYLQWIPHHALIFRGRDINLAREPYHLLVEMFFFSASAFTTAFFTTSIVRVLTRRIIDLARLSEAVKRANEKFNALFSMVQAIGSIRNLTQMLDIVTQELSLAMRVKAVSVKLLSEDDKYLRYAAAFGLPDAFFRKKVIEVARSPLNRRIIEGEPFATGHLDQRDMFQFGEDLAEARIQSVLFMPLTVEERVIGILGAYCTEAERFGSEEVEFFALAAGLVAIALDNARSYEGIEKLMQERSWFMMRVAHNLRAPLAAVLSMIEVLREGLLGSLNHDQTESLRRIDRRARTLLSLINELMILSRSRTEKQTEEKKLLDFAWLAGRIQRTFQDEAAEKRLRFSVKTAENLPPIRANAEALEQLFENLVSNAIKYTLPGGEVRVVFTMGAEGLVEIEVSDTGIGIPADAVPRLFSEFFRAPNAKELEEVGTGLGLSIVKEIVDLHGGRIQVRSTEGAGATFTVHLPVASRPAEPTDA